MKRTIKTISVLIMVIFVLSLIPMALAENTTNATGNTLRQRIQQRVDDLKEKADNYLRLRAQYMDEVSNYYAARADFLRLKGYLIEHGNRTINESDIARIKAFYNKAIDRGVKHIQIVEAWVDKSKLPDEQKTEYKNILEADITLLNDMKPKVDAIQTREDAVAVAKELRDAWIDVQIDFKKIVGYSLGIRMDTLIEKSQAISPKIQDKIDTLKEQGKDVTELQTWLDDYNAKLTLAKEKVDAAKAKYDEIKTPIDPKEAEQLFAEARQFIKEAHQYLKDAHSDLVKIVQKLRELGNKDIDINKEIEGDDANETG